MSYSKNTLMKAPSGRWIFVGSVHKNLSYVKKDGTEPTEKDLQDANHVGPGIIGLETKAWDTPLEALEAAKKYDQVVTITAMDMENPEIQNAIKMSGVQYQD